MGFSLVRTAFLLYLQQFLKKRDKRSSKDEEIQRGSVSFADDDGVFFSSITVTQRRNICGGRCKECLSLVNRDTGREDTSFYFCNLGEDR